jgi:carboxyl-terminal processing protease
MRRATIVWMMAWSAAAACTDPGPAEPDGSMSPVARAYLEDALDVMESSSVRRHEIDWTVFREATFDDAVGAETTSDTYPAVIAALERLGDDHSFFREPVGTLLPAHGGPPRAALLGEVAYLDVPAFSGGGEYGDSLATRYHRLIEGVDTLPAATCRWVVDIRGNTGGNMWPMIAGVGPILGEGTVGSFVDPDSVSNAWIYEGGEARLDHEVINAARSAYTLTGPRARVAVLTDGRTASSGEAVAVAFRARRDARSFGQATWGISTANAPFLLSDGAVIFLTVSTMADREGTVYGRALAPDEPVVGEKTGNPETDPVLRAALEWLSTKSCG